ncbi:hypothetical protein DJ533_00105 (plasmid) [Acinetobacter defluvii]|uniref:Uncharacterized protein n=1 Tax=Acinetobacter defluvii TaxID=1871111 RepID=A0A2S2F9W2_9GAMM|nr:hypothetical protein [Acinetobacter defluvii]AWL27122.1 hypothetical protein DJ533_00105 [Acinetobacter defluvii]
MNRLSELSKISNAVLSPDLNGRCRGDLRTGLAGRCKVHDSGKLSQKEIKFRVEWCIRQHKIIGEFGAVLNAD